MEKIELTEIEATAYWWTKQIRSKIREIEKETAPSDHELEFNRIFIEYRAEEWRDVYQHFNNHIKNYIDKKEMENSIVEFYQNTRIKEHNQINEALEILTHTRIPDIRLASYSSKDLETTLTVYSKELSKATIWYETCGEMNLPKLEDASYILTGDLFGLHFYNSLLATIYVLSINENNFKSVSLLRDIFCECYSKETDYSMSFQELKNIFDYCFNYAADLGIIIGRAFKDQYFTHFSDLDILSFESYKSKAEIYANQILKYTYTKSMI